MLISRKKYNDLLAALDKAIENNHELRKTCWCMDCKHGNEFIEGVKCFNPECGSYRQYVNYYGSCEKCERR